MKEKKIVHGEIRSEITPGKVVSIHLDGQPSGENWYTRTVVKILSVVVYNGKLGVKFETGDAEYTVVQDLNK